MAEMALYLRDPERGYEVGDVVDVLPDGSDWGSRVCVDDFLIVRIPDVSANELKHRAMEMRRDRTTGLWAWAYSGDSVIEPDWELVKRRRYALDINATMAASGIDPDAWGRVYVEDWLVYEVIPVWIDKAGA